MRVEVSNMETPVGTSCYHDPTSAVSGSTDSCRRDQGGVASAAFVGEATYVVKDAPATEAKDEVITPSAAEKVMTTATSTAKSLEEANSDKMNAQSYRDHIYQQVRALLDEHGGGYIQKKLQEEIAKVKKRESDVASMRKRVSAVSQRIAVLNDRRRKLEAAKSKAELLCQTLQSSLKKRQELTSKLSENMEQHRQDVKTRVEAAVATTRGEMEQRREALSTLGRENEKLAAELEEKKQSFEEVCSAFESGLRDRAAYFQNLMKDCSAVAREVETLEGKIFLTRREHMSVEQTRRSLEAQLATHKEYFDTVLQSSMKPEDVQRLLQIQRENMGQRILRLESDKREAAELRAKFDSETCELRGKLAALRKEMPALEKTKAAAERLCRKAQQEFRQNNH